MVAAGPLLATCDGGSPTVPPAPSNRAPQATGSIPSVAVTAGESTTVDVGPAFRDPDGDPLTYSATTSSPGIAAVSVSGSRLAVSGVAAGTATVTVAAADPSGASARQSFAVTVMQSAGSVTVLPAADTIAPGDTLRLVAEAFDENGHRMQRAEFVWASSDVSVVRVNESGLVTGVGEGSATVTARVGEASAASQITVENPDRSALVAFYRAVDGPNWTNNENWLTDAPLGEWKGVDTDSTGRVIRLRLSSNELTGTIPPELGNLSELTYVELNVNRLAGPIPPEIGNLANLVWLSLTRNLIAGTIPPELGNLSRLEGLFLNSNWLDGTVPPELGNLPNLRRLGLDLNRLTGAIPRRFLQSSLQEIHLNDNDGLCVPGTSDFVVWTKTLNRYRGSLCNESDIAALEHLYTATGGRSWTDSRGWLTEEPIEDWYGVGVDTLGLVEVLDLSQNGLSGHLPSHIADLTRMTELRLTGNSLSGRLPLSLDRLPLDVFHYSGTNLCVPPEPALKQWIAEISSHVGTGVECAPLSDRDRLIALYDATGGLNWKASTGWLSDSALGSWYGVDVDDEGSVVRLRLPDNMLTGRIPPELGGLGRLTDLVLSGNGLMGEIPPELGGLTNLQRLELDRNDLTGLVPSGFETLANLNTLNLALNELRGPIPPELASLGNLRQLVLSLNRLTGNIPSQLGTLVNLESLQLHSNDLTGPIPPEFGNLASLQMLDLRANDLTGTVPAEFGNLANLLSLELLGNDLTGPIPSEISNLANLQNLNVSRNDLTGPIPPEIGNLSNLRNLNVSQNDLVGPIPPEIGNLANLFVLDLSQNDLTGPIPPEIGSLTNVRIVNLSRNTLSGSIPAELGGLVNLRDLTVAWNEGFSGALPSSLTNLRYLETLQVGGTALCAPVGVLEWLKRVPNGWVPLCEGDTATAYLVQSVQSRHFPVPLVAGREALLRVFVTAAVANDVDLPPVRATLYVGGARVHVADIPGRRGPVPTEVDESTLAGSANALIPPEVIRPGLELTIEIDPDETLDPGLGVSRRIPESGRLRVDVQAVPDFDLTVVPVLRTASADSSILSITRPLTAESDLFHETRTLLPIGALTLTVHEPFTTTSSGHRLLSEIEAIRIMEGVSGYVLGLHSPDVGNGGMASGRSSISVNNPITIAHELGHNLSLQHAPCGSAFGVDPLYPHPNGTIGAWGYDARGGNLVPPDHYDLMGYCGPQWISDYSFAKSLRWRLLDGGASLTSDGEAPSRSLLLWGGIRDDGQPYLDPAFVIDAIPSLPATGGEYAIEGTTADGMPIFSFTFDMPTTGDAEGVETSFVFALPVQAEWEEDLARITLLGPHGSVALEEATDRPMAILRDLRTGQVRGFLRNLPTASHAAPHTAEPSGSPALDMLFSRGIPDAEAWRR